MPENKDTLIALAKSLDSVAYALHNFCVKTLEALGESAHTADVQAVVAAATTAPSPAVGSHQSEAKPLKLEDVRAVMAEKSRQGKTEEIRALLEKYGANKLSEISPNDYAALLADAEAICNG